MKYSILSKYRSELMGLAILWVLFSHTSLIIYAPIISGVKDIGYGGVDIFLMVSGMGLYYSFSNDQNICRFYKRRLKRILPTYLPVVLTYDSIRLIFHKIIFSTLILNCFTIPFWLGLKNYFDWYIPALLMLYLFSPLIVRIFNNQRSKWLKLIFITLCIVFSIVLSIISILLKKEYLLIFTCRIPIFCIGILIGYCSKEEKLIKNSHKIFLTIAFLLGNILLYIVCSRYAAYAWQFGLWWWPFILITLPLCILLAIVLNRLEVLIGYRCKILNYCGKLSLELYLFFTCINNLIGRSLANKHFDSINLLSTLIVLFITFAVASIWYRMLYILKGIIKGGEFHALYLFNSFKHR